MARLGGFAGQLLVSGLIILGCTEPGDEVLSARILFEGAGVVRATSTDGVQRFIVPTGPDPSGAYTASVSPDGRREKCWWTAGQETGRRTGARLPSQETEPGSAAFTS